MVSHLSKRDRLPDALRTLLDSYPRDDWRTHENFGSMVEFWLDRHNMFRGLAEVLRKDSEGWVDGTLDPQELAPRLARYGSLMVQQLHEHHQVEDIHYFPALKKLETSLNRGFEILDKDHHAIDDLLDRFTRSANALLQGKAEPGEFHDELTSFEAMLLRHLEDEEDLIVPVILKHGYNDSL